MRMLQTQLLFRIIHSVNQLSIYGAVSTWCEQSGLAEDVEGVLSSVTSHEVRLLVSYPRLVFGNSYGFWELDSMMPRTDTFPSKPTIQSLCSNSWRNNYWTGQ